MDKNTVTIIIVSFFTFLCMNAALYIFVDNYLKENYPENEENTVTNSDSLSNSNSSLYTLTDNKQRAEELKKIVKELINDVHNIKNPRNIAHNKLDSVETDIFYRIDELIKNNQILTSQIDELKELKTTNINTLKTKSEEIISLENQIDSLNIEKARILTKKIQDSKAKNYTYLAQTFDTMKPLKVAQLLMSFDNNSTIEILKRMNQRKTGKVLAAMPTFKSVSISKEIIK